jgi:CspA family cold shock protein
MTMGMVKFFNPDKGFGFIIRHDGGEDVFVHVSAVEQSGLTTLNEGDEVSFEVQENPRSGKAAAVDIAVIGSASPGTKPPKPRLPPRGDRQRGQELQPRSQRVHEGEGSGVVKWFNPAKGFGFIQPHDGGEDVFIHARVLEKAGLRSLNDGQPVAYEIERDRRTGKMAAASLRLN